MKQSSEIVDEFLDLWADLELPTGFRTALIGLVSEVRYDVADSVARSLNAPAGPE